MCMFVRVFVLSVNVQINDKLACVSKRTMSFPKYILIHRLLIESLVDVLYYIRIGSFRNSYMSMSWKLIKSGWEMRNTVCSNPPYLNPFGCVRVFGVYVALECSSALSKIQKFAATSTQHKIWIHTHNPFPKIWPNYTSKIWDIYFVSTNRIEQATKFTPSSIIWLCSVGHQIFRETIIWEHSRWMQIN